MKPIFYITILFLALSFKHKEPKKVYCQIQTLNCISNKVDTIYFKAKGGLCIVTLDNDTIPKLADYSDRILKDSVCEFKVLKFQTTKFKIK